MRRWAVLLACLLLGCEATTAANGPPPAGMSPVVAGVREAPQHWRELLADPSAAAARTRAQVVAAAVLDDPELYRVLQEREPLPGFFAHGLEDAKRAAEAFPDAPDVWLTLARLEAYAGDIASSSAAACKGARLDPLDGEMAQRC